MLISQWRTGLKAWLLKYLTIDTWELRNPIDYNRTNGFIPPLQGIICKDDSLGTCMANQDIYLTTRYRGDLKYDQLPLGQLEQLYSTIGARLSSTYASIAPLIDFELLSVPECIQVTEYGDDLADWLITLVFSANITWLPTATALPGDVQGKAIIPTRIDIGLFTMCPSSSDISNPVNRNKVGTLITKMPK